MPSPSTERTPGRFARALTGRRVSKLLALVPLLLGILVIALVPAATHDQAPTDSMPAGMDSTLAAELADELPETDAEVAIALWTTTDDGELSPQAVRQVSRQTLQLLSELTAGEADGMEHTRDRGEKGAAPAGGEEAGDHPEAESPLTVSEDGSAAMAVLPVTATNSDQRIDAVEDLRKRLAEETPDGVDVAVTGPAALQADFGQVFAGADFKLLGVTAVVVAILLIITYRSPVLWLVPLLVVGVADRTASIAATHVLSGLGLVWNESTVGILSVLVFGAGTNYALLLISRYRDELKSTDDRFEAMARAYGPTAEAVFASATTVILGLLTLLLSLVPNTRGLGLACAVGVLIAASFVMLVLPAAMLLFGRGLFWPVVPRVGEALLVDSETSIWSRIGRAVSGRPRTFVAASLLVVIGLGLGMTQIQVGLRAAEQFLDTPESVSGAERLGEHFPAGSSDPVTVLTRQDPQLVVDRISGADDVTAVRVSAQGEGVARLDVTTESSPSTEANEATVRALRAELEDLDDTHVGGGTAEEMDESEGASRDERLLVPIILGLVVVALVLILRSVVAPLILVSTVLATFVAAMGASWWVFTQVLDFSALHTSVPLLAFLFLVALGVDYNIFLVTRAVEEARNVGTRTGILRALTATGGVITSAGILLASVFAVLGVLPLVMLAQFGVVVFIGVLLDTLLVRTVLVPAVVLTLGDRFWWPRKVGPTEG
ncbi:MAG: MMPL family transporter [Nocardioides sp.]|uniref:MMPL family transporter n=1 Tax=Nocardioides sp. TaxID=35761 RepID=UPI003F03967B